MLTCTCRHVRACMTVSNQRLGIAEFSRLPFDAPSTHWQSIPAFEHVSRNVRITVGLWALVWSCQHVDFQRIAAISLCVVISCCSMNPSPEMNDMKPVHHMDIRARKPRRLKCYTEVD